MKRFLIVLILGVILFSCSMQQKTIFDNFTYDGPRFTSRDVAAQWLSSNWKYKTDIEYFGKDDYWQTPSESQHAMTGDCEDRGIYFLAICYKLFGDEGVLEEYYGNSCVLSHTAVKVNSITFFENSDYPVLYHTYTLADINNEIFFHR